MIVLLQWVLFGGVLSGNTFNNVCLGGLTRDGQPAANRLEMLLLEAGMTCQTTQPTLSVLYDDKLPEEFLLKAVECEKSGTGYPPGWNNRGGSRIYHENYGPEGMNLEDARPSRSAAVWKLRLVFGKNWN